ncbi:hypothetical protein TREMEDRAFT_60782 [Tremella mesenterica DSM 1558]|uniref:uncharacterized protein n=1 Tax=Tremella mesenterica (strain ATCC 24925 / CBS 8224 / DSM 1558 / NBRC 9311 / NRRL Y-6157 / RJB 2259-6 / UBC 559-6) TaxID=578456 RepID=UPI0003F48F2D|nr:uncharacterized protein TREMEDRAFT_60782 [Tremella mesenterica DSM 1558]EIW71859.1 hypothetical protein TREMEDRAFT_60782 [Tremella mesenterica DSM 1558]
MNNTHTRPMGLANLLNPQSSPSTVPISEAEQTSQSVTDSNYSGKHASDESRLTSLTVDQRMLSRLDQYTFAGIPMGSPSSHPSHRYPIGEESESAFPSNSEAFGPQPQHAWYGDDLEPWRNNHSKLLNTSVPPQAPNHPQLTYQSNRFSSSNQGTQGSTYQGPSNPYTPPPRYQRGAYQTPRNLPSRMSISNGAGNGYHESTQITTIEAIAIEWDSDDEGYDVQDVNHLYGGGGH